ncbi:2-hydroxyacid dehydrogenase family protein [Lentilactobacillus senioris]|uniref:2-hydroxyacid dehydrogenase family protein n=1 Tax=Lentilactobacillus senioris TaxID=931534 RepID=UPI0022826C7C|nr:2-hydroxyacid dehydrogenase family protein [Lentilactobacillus senioris]MCY9806068.1 2-hydroxyacid dehydrogenase family protein [Lentilactobacillus senioris]
MMKVFISAQLPAITVEKIEAANIEVTMYSQDTLITHAELLAAVQDVDFLITPLSTQVDKEIIDGAPKLKLIANFGAGFNNIDFKYARSKNIAVTNTPVVSTNSVAEVTLGLILDLSHRIVEGDMMMRTTGFPGWSPLFFLGHEIAGKTLGIVGMGNIGQAVAQKARALSMNVQYWQHHQLSDPEERSLGAKYVSMAELLKTSDFISINAPLTDENFHQFNAAAFEQMKKTVALINVGRGPIVDEAALVKALQAGEIGGAALDVYEHEPQVTPVLTEMKNVILTPHIGNATVEARDAMGNIVAENIIAVANQQAPKYVIN